MKFQLPVKGCFLQRCHEINDERKRERERERERRRQEECRANDSVKVSGPWRRRPFQQRAARFNLVKVFSYHFNSVLSHAHGSLSRQIGRYRALRGHAETFTVPVRRFAPLPGLVLCSSCAWDESFSFYLTAGRKSEKKREFARLSSLHCFPDRYAISTFRCIFYVL